MPLVDDLRASLDDQEHSRRLFLGAVGASAITIAGLGTGVTAIRFLWPEVLFEEETRYRIGRPEEIPVGTLVALPQQKVFLMHASEGFFAMSAVCTHLGCLTQYERENGRIFCPCHGSRFSLDGQVQQGPAPAALPRLSLALEDGFLVIDVSRPAEPDALLRV